MKAVDGYLYQDTSTSDSRTLSTRVWSTSASHVVEWSRHSRSKDRFGGVGLVSWSSSTYPRSLSCRYAHFKEGM